MENVFSAVSAQLLYNENPRPAERIESLSLDDSPRRQLRWQKRNQAVKRRLYVYCNDSDTVTNPLPG
jgi:hypothetical protein